MKDVIEGYEKKIERHVNGFKNWIFKNFTKAEIVEGNIDDTAYPYWKEIANDLEKLFQEVDLRVLNVEAKRNLIYLIGRNWNLGWILSWLSPTNDISNLGVISEEEFLDLCEVALNTDEREAKYQFAAIFEKFGELDEKREKLLLALYNQNDEYTQRISLYSLGKLKYYKVEELVEKTWNTNDQWHRIVCLQVLKDIESPLLYKYVKLAKEDGRSELLFHLEQILEIRRKK